MKYLWPGAANPLTAALAVLPGGLLLAFVATISWYYVANIPNYTPRFSQQTVESSIDRFHDEGTGESLGSFPDVETFQFHAGLEEARGAPLLDAVSDIRNPEKWEVLCLSVEQQNFAFAIDGMRNMPHSVVSVPLGDRQLLVSYNCTKDHARARSSLTAERVEVTMRELNNESELLYVLDGVPTLQRGRHEAFEDLPLQRMKLSQWGEIHQDAIVYMGSLRDF